MWSQEHMYMSILLLHKQNITRSQLNNVLCYCYHVTKYTEQYLDLLNIKYFD